MTFAVRHDVEGPKVRLGIAWFTLTIGACVLSPLALAAVLAVAAALAADQVVRTHLPATGPLIEDLPRLVAVLGAAALPLAASQGGDTLAGATAVVVVLSLLVAGTRGAVPVLAVFAVGMACASPVLAHRFGTAAALVLLLLVAVYDASDFIVGTGSTTWWEGPVAGAIAVLVIATGVLVLAPPPLQEEGVIALGALTALLAPMGPPLASMLVGDGQTPARYVRRVDSLLLAGPVSAWFLLALLPQLAR
jgi:hypothetical protein